MLEIMSGTDLRPIDKTLIHSSDWGLSQSNYFNLNGTYQPGVVGPHGQKHVIRSVSNGNNGWTGGWNSSFVQVDNTKLHRLTAWVKIVSISGAAVSDPLQRGYIYLGTNGGGSFPVNNVEDAATNLNPYFHVTQVSLLPEGEWLLLVGYVHGVNAPNQESKVESGIWRLNTQSLLHPAWNDYRFNEGSTALQQRCYHYYDQIPGIDVLYNDPRIDVCDGTEPTISELLNGYGVNMRKRPIIA